MESDRRLNDTVDWCLIRHLCLCLLRGVRIWITSNTCSVSMIKTSSLRPQIITVVFGFNTFSSSELLPEPVFHPHGTSPAMLAILILVPTVYVVASSIEWFIHRYIMHSIDNRKIPIKALRTINRQHVLHHNVTNTDMTIKPSLDGYKKQKLSERQEKFQGLYFTWRINIAITVGFIVGSAIVNFVVGVVLSPVIVYDVTYTVAISVGLVICLWMNVIWNYVHPTLHHAEGLKWNEGLDLLPRRDWMQDTFLYNYLWKHHVLHHFLKGENAGNFNVTLPGADWLYGTYYTECKGYKIDVKNKKIYKLKQ